MGWFVAQIGNREYYLPARCLHRSGQLRRMYTDIWWRHPALARFLPGGMKDLASRRHGEIPDEKVVSWNLSSITRRAASRFKASSKSKADVFRDYISDGRHFATQLARALGREHIEPESDRLFLYSTGALETLQFAREKGLMTILDQLDPAQLDERMVNEEIERWPGWERSEAPVPAEYYQRLQAEWELADLIVVNSNWSKQALLESGISADRVVVIPLAYEPDAPEAIEHQPKPSNGPLRILWLGQVILRKGIPYVIDAARRLPECRFEIVGPIGISESAMESAPSNVIFHGKVSREEVVRFYRQSDLFVLPTLSDGFAITQIEAMSHGLPVIATDHCGQVVTDGEDGFVIQIRDVDALTDRIGQLAANRSRFLDMKHQALQKSKQFTLARFGAELLNLSYARPQAT